MKIKHRENRFIAISFFLLMMFHVAVNSQSVEDLPSYQETFLRIAPANFSQIFGLIRNTDYSYAIFNKICSLVSWDFTHFLLIYNLFLLGTIYAISRKYSPYLSVSIVLFLAIGYNQSLFVLREYLAISILLWTIPFIIKRSIIPYVVLCVVAFFMHSSSIIWFPVFFIYNIRNTKYFIVALLCMIAGISYLCSNPTAIIMALGLEFESYVRNDVTMNTTMKTIPLVYLLAYCLFLKRHILDEGINKLCFISLVIYTITYMFAPPLGLIGRILKYYEILSFISVPIAMSYSNSNLLKLLYFLSIIFFQGYLTIRGLDEFYISDYQLNSITIEFVLLILFATITVLYLLNNNITKLSNKKRDSILK